MKIVKRDGRIADFNFNKIEEAIFKAAASVQGTDKLIAHNLALVVQDQLTQMNKDSFHVEEIQDCVEKVLIESGHAKTAKAYILYRQKRTETREINSQLQKTLEELLYKDASEVDDKRENANIDADSMCGTIMKVAGTLLKPFNMNHMMRPEHKRMHEEGRIHWHKLYCAL